MRHSVLLRLYHVLHLAERAAVGLLAQLFHHLVALLHDIHILLQQTRHIFFLMKPRAFGFFRRASTGALG